MPDYNNFSMEEQRLLRRLTGPAKIQDFLETLEINFEKNGETCMSPRVVLETGKAHCMEGAMFAAAALEFNGFDPLVVDLRATKRDFDHVVAVYKQFGCWGAISKTNHAVLRYREPIYKTIRELVLSYFHEYFDDQGRKNLRDYSLPVNLRRYDKLGWRTASEDLWDIPYGLDKVKHIKILSKTQIKNLRKAGRIEIKAGKLVEWKK